MRIIRLVCLCLLLFTGCQDLREEVNLDGLANQTNKLVVTGFLSPQDTLLAVKVNRTRPIADPFNSTNGLVTNAKVTLNSNGRSITLTYNAKQQYYQVDAKKLPIKAGEAYGLIVETPDGARVTSSCTIPQVVSLQQVLLDSLQNSDGTKQYFIRYHWQDSAKAKNFYQTISAFAYLRRCQNCSVEEKQKNKPVSSLVNFGVLANSSGLITDENQDGLKMQSERGWLETDSTDKANSTAQTVFADYYANATVTAALLHVDEAYYRYHTAVELTAKYDDNPFAEPVLIPSNIQGGLGCFSGYNKSLVRVSLKK